MFDRPPENIDTQIQRWEDAFPSSNETEIRLSWHRTARAPVEEARKTFDSFEEEQILQHLLHPDIAKIAYPACLTFLELSAKEALLLLSLARNGNNIPILPSNTSEYTNAAMLLHKIGIDLDTINTTHWENQCLEIINAQFPGKLEQFLHELNFLFTISPSLELVRYRIPGMDQRLDFIQYGSPLNPFYSDEEYTKVSKELNRWVNTWRGFIPNEVDGIKNAVLEWGLATFPYMQINDELDFKTNDLVCAALSFPTLRKNELSLLSALRKMYPEHLGLIMVRALCLPKHEAEICLGTMIRNQIRLGANANDILQGLVLAAQHQSSFKTRSKAVNDMNGSIRYINKNLRETISFL